MNPNLPGEQPKQQQPKPYEYPPELWAKARPSANWMATDEDGFVYDYIGLPMEFRNLWEPSDILGYHCVGCSSIPCNNWRETLQQRPKDLSGCGKAPVGPNAANDQPDEIPSKEVLPEVTRSSARAAQSLLQEAITLLEQSATPFDKACTLLRRLLTAGVREDRPADGLEPSKAGEQEDENERERQYEMYLRVCEEVGIVPVPFQPEPRKEGDEPCPVSNESQESLTTPATSNAAPKSNPSDAAEEAWGKFVSSEKEPPCSCTNDLANLVAHAPWCQVVKWRQASQRRAFTSRQPEIDQLRAERDKYRRTLQRIANGQSFQSAIDAAIKETK